MFSFPSFFCFALITLPKLCTGSITDATSNTAIIITILNKKATTKITLLESTTDGFNLSEIPNRLYGTFDSNHTLM